MFFLSYGVCVESIFLHRLIKSVGLFSLIENKKSKLEFSLEILPDIGSTVNAGCNWT